MLADNREDDGEKKEKDRESGRKRRSAVKIKNKTKSAQERGDLPHTVRRQSIREVKDLRRRLSYFFFFLNRALEKRTIVRQKPPQQQQHWSLFLARPERPAASAQFCFVIYIIHFQFGSYFSRHRFSRCHIKKNDENVSKREQGQALRHQQNVTLVIFWIADAKSVFSAR